MILRFLGSSLFLFAIVFTIPLAFDIGGRTCGLAFSLTVSSYYFFLSILRLVTPRTSIWRKSLMQIFVGLQALVIPSLLIWSLNKYSIDSNSDKSANWVARAFYNASKPFQQNATLKDRLFGTQGLLETTFLGGWDKLLRYSTPVFQILEGFCSLLVIQAAGQVTRYVVNGEGGDGWMIGSLIFSASTISSSVYFLWRVATFPSLDTQDAVLIGIGITCAFFLCAWGIGSGRGNAVESSLLFAYVTLCIYQIYTDYQPSSKSKARQETVSATDFPPLPPILMASYSTLTAALANLPSAIHSAGGFILAALATITPSVIISLAYRLTVFYAAARIIPAVRESGARALADSPDPSDHSDGEGVSAIVSFIATFSPSILIAVYTSLLMQHFASASADQPGEWWTSQGGDGAPTGGNVWRWANLGGTMALYAVELYLGGREDEALAYGGHWKLD